ncbi:MAG TPA: hypothetical protein VF928_03740 [Usitatibacteraceae bacterium]
MMVMTAAVVRIVAVIDLAFMPMVMAMPMLMMLVLLLVIVVVM